MPVRIRPLEQSPSRSGSVGHFDCWSKGTPAPLLTGKIMKYEKKYKEALERARNLYPGVHSHNKAMLEQIFPELSKSEDERIIDDAIQIIRASRLRCAEYGSEADKHLNAIAWLEKQKEKSEIPIIPIMPTPPSGWGCDGTHCTNPQMDCINCPRKTTGGSFSTSSASGTSAATLHGNTSVTDGKPHNPSFTD